MPHFPSWNSAVPEAVARPGLEMLFESLRHLTHMGTATEKEILDFAVDCMVKLTESKSGFLFFPPKCHSLTGRVIRSGERGGISGTATSSADALPWPLADLMMTMINRDMRRVIRNGTRSQPALLTLDGRLEVLRYMALSVYDGDRLVYIAWVCDKENAAYREDDLNLFEAFINGVQQSLRRQEFVRELQQAKEAAERANIHKNEFIVTISHELRTPLNGMLSSLQLLESMTLNEQQRELVRIADLSGRTLLRIMADILDFGSIEMKKLTLLHESFDFKNTFVSSLELFRSEAANRGLSLDIHVGENIPDRMLGDEARVRQILFNIVGNALKFTEKGGIRAECSILPHGGSGWFWIYLAIADTGIGIAEENLARIFEAFTRVSGSATRKSTGTGLGLAIVQYLVGVMGGSLAVESEPGLGTTIHCSLRFARIPENTGDAASPETPEEVFDKHLLHVLVVEDDDISRYTLEQFLRRLGHVPVCVSNGRLALEMLQLYPFHCVFTDIQMPEMDGLELVRRIRLNTLDGITPSDAARSVVRGVFPDWMETISPFPTDILTVTVSAHTIKGDKERFLNAGMDFYIAKPVVIKELDEVLRKIAARLGRGGKKAPAPAPPEPCVVEVS